MDLLKTGLAIFRYDRKSHLGISVQPFNVLLSAEIRKLAKRAWPVVPQITGLMVLSLIRRFKHVPLGFGSNGQDSNTVQMSPAFLSKAIRFCFRPWVPITRAIVAAKARGLPTFQPGSTEPGCVAAWPRLGGKPLPPWEQ
jgi:hypothetical protein